MKLETYLQHIISLDAPHVMKFMTGSYDYFISYVISHSKDCNIELFDGIDLQTWPDLSKNFSIRYKFPRYYGGNIEAFTDMMSDLEWLPRKQSRLVIFKNSHILLSKESDSRYNVIELFGFIAEKWSRPAANLDPDLFPAKPFHVLFHVPKGYNFQKIPAIDFSGTPFA